MAGNFEHHSQKRSVKTSGCSTVPNKTASFKAMDFDVSPYLVLWELTRSCALACRHCRAKAIRNRNPQELNETQISAFLDELEQFNSPLLVLTGGDPIQRPDLFEIIQETKRRGFRVAMTPSATPSISQRLVQKLKLSGVERLAISLDGANELSHDYFRRVQGSFNWSMNIIDWANYYQLPLQINSTVCRNTIDSFDEMAELVAKASAVLWSVFFLVPTGRATQTMQIEPDEAETIMKKMAHLSMTSSFDVKATAGPHFRRVLIEHFSSSQTPLTPESIDGVNKQLRLGALRSYRSVNDGQGLLFVSHTGEIYPSGFLPVCAGNVKTDSVVATYQEHPLFKDLRNPSLLKGKCGRCHYRNTCGGSRARAYALHGDYLAQDDLCAYDNRPQDGVTVYGNADGSPQ
jgi:radical SAM protein